MHFRVKEFIFDFDFDHGPERSMFGATLDDCISSCCSSDEIGQLPVEASTDAMADEDVPNDRLLQMLLGRAGSSEEEAPTTSVAHSHCCF